MPGRWTLRYRYREISDWEKNREQVASIVREDTQQEFWPETKSLPPMGMPPPMSKEGIEKLKALTGVLVDADEKEVDEEE